MKITRILAIALVAGSLGVSTLHAQITEQQPAEFPPPSYKGKQYVDSKGCVFIRAGIDGNVSWIPRVTRARKTVCGFKPSIVGQVAPAPAPVPAAEEPVEITLDIPAAPSAAQQAPRVAAKPRKVPARVVRQTAPKKLRRTTQQPVVVAEAPATKGQLQVQTACPDASPLSQQYLRRSKNLAVRCGPQTAPIVGANGVIGDAQVAGASGQYAGTPASASQITTTTRIVPRHVAYNRINTRNVSVPKGYKKVWEDDRLNPYRAEQNLQGRSQMLLIWTQTVPRRLIDRRSGRDVTASVPLIYPYLDVTTQSRELGEVTIVQRDGQIAKRVVRNPGVRKPVYSSRSAPSSKATNPATPGTLARNHYVQIGTFGQSENAQRSAQNIARMGFPSRIGKHRRNGKTFLTVQAGPFNDERKLQTAIKRLRGAGYTDAFARK